MAGLRLIFFGTAELAGASLRALLESQLGEIHAVVTQPDRPKGRDLKLTPSPVKTLALVRGLPVLQPERARSEDFLRALGELRPDLIVVAAYGQILSEALLRIPPHGCINVHTSLLPRHRGAAPIQWAILDGDAETGVTIMQMDAGLDTGPILTQSRTAIADADDARTLHDRLAKLGGELLVQTIPGYVRGEITPQPQPAEGVTYARKITKADGELDWRLPARVLWNRIRGLTPWPGTFTHWSQHGARRLVKVWSARVADGGSGPPGAVLRADHGALVIGCGEGALQLLSLQREGGRILPAAEFLAGHRWEVGQRLG